LRQEMINKIWSKSNLIDFRIIQILIKKYREIHASNHILGNTIKNRFKRVLY